MGKKGRRKTKFIPLVFPAEVVPPWTELPLDLTANILRRLGDVDILHSAQFVCSTWWKVCHDPYMWRTINIANKDSMYMDHCTTLYRCAVDRSQGQLINLTIGFFMHDELLYVAERSSHLRRLTIVWCMLLSRRTLTEAVKLLPELEELHLIMPPFDLLSEDIETIGLSCPRLKSFTLDRPDELRCHCDHDHDDDDEFEEEEEDDDEFEEEEEDDDDAINKEAAAIARSMPNLQHLVLANAMNNKGLAAILDGCRRLESLDLRRCFGVDPDEELGERCFEQIKHVRFLSDEYSVDDDDNGWDFSSSSSINKGRSGRMPSHSFSYWLDDDGNGNGGGGGGGGYDSELDDYDYDDNRMTADQIVECGKKLAF